MSGRYGDELADIFRGPITVYWAGFESDTYRMQHDGWRMVVNRTMSWHSNRDEFEVLMQGHGVSLRGKLEGVNPNIIARDRNFSSMRILISNAVAGDMRLVTSAPLTMMYRPVGGMYGDRVTMREMLMSSIFPPVTGREELIVAPDDVAALMAKIRKLQTPELLAIRERNKRRQLEEQPMPEQTIATILSIAA